MKELRRYINPNIKYICLGGVCLLIEVLAETGIPKLMTLAVKNAVISQNSGKVVTYGVVMVLVALIGCVGGLLGLRFASRASSMSAGAIRKALFSKIQKLPLDAFDSASLSLRLGFDINQIQSLLQMFFRILIRAPLLFCGAMIMASTINRRLTVIFWVTSIVAGIVVVLITKKSYKRFAIAQTKLETVNRIIKEDITAVKDIRAFQLEESETEKFMHAADEYKIDNTRALRILSLTSPISTMIVNLSAVPIVWFGRGLLGSEFAVEDIIAFTTYIGQILLAFMMISMVIMLYSKSKVSIDRVNEILNAKELTCGHASSAENINRGHIEFRNISYKYVQGKGIPVLDKLSFSIEPGSYVAIVGGTGSGKTTIASLLSRMIIPCSGQIFIDNVDITEFSEKNLRSKLIPVFQSGELLSGTIGSNISSGEKASVADLESAAQMAQLKDFIEDQTEQYDYTVNAKASNLSGGQKQRLALARALYKKGQIYFFDDCISALNPAIRSKIMHEIETMDGVTRIVLSQRPDEVVNADKIYLLERGKIAAEGTHDYLFANYPNYRYYCNTGIASNV